MEAKYTLAAKGSKTVSVRGADSNNRCTIMLGASLTGVKAEPYIVFKGAKGGRISTELRRREGGYNDGTVLTVQENAWFDEEIMMHWIENVWQNQIAVDPTQNYYLLLDAFSVHQTAKVRDMFNKCNTEIDYIPEGYTSRLQMMDVGVNKPFKVYIRNEFDDWLIANAGNRTKPTRQMVANWIKSAYDHVTDATFTNSWWKAMRLPEREVANSEQEQEQNNNFDEDEEENFLLLTTNEEEEAEIALEEENLEMISDEEQVYL
jgi:hypothetical protein